MTKICFNAHSREEFMWYCKKYDVKDARVGTIDYDWWFDRLMGDNITWYTDERGILGANPISIKEFLQYNKDYTLVNKRFELGQMQ